MLRLYWLIVALVTAIAVHAGFILFAPAYRFSQQAGDIMEGHGANRFFILTAEQQARLFPNLPRQSVTGVCFYDVSRGGVTLNASVPEGFWITTIYSSRGKAIYSVNNRQSGADVFAVSLSRAPGLIELVMQATDNERPEIDSGWTVMSPEPRGLALVWYPLADPAMRKSIADAMGRSRCVADGTGDS